MNISDSPCKDCTDRNATCHGSCEKYSLWTGEYAKYKHEKQKYDIEQYVMRDYEKQKCKKLRRIMNFYKGKTK